MILSRNSTQADSYYQLARAGQLFCATAVVTAPVKWTTAAGMGGPLLWNNTGPAAGGGARVMAVVIGVGVGWTTAPGATGQLGLTWGSGQTSAPTTTTAIDGVANMFPGGAAPLCNTYRIGTVANAGVAFLATHSVSTANGPAASTLETLDGMVQIPPGSWVSVAGSAAISSLVATISLVWAEVPY